MTKKAVAALLTVVVGTVLALFIRHDGQEVQRVHDANLVRAEQFKREFDRQVAEGATVEAVEEYLRTKPVKSSRSVAADGRTVIELRIEVVNERSPVWGCGRQSVGIFAAFVEQRLAGTRATAWSLDCM